MRGMRKDLNRNHNDYELKWGSGRNFPGCTSRFDRVGGGLAPTPNRSMMRDLIAEAVR